MESLILFFHKPSPNLVIIHLKVTFSNIDEYQLLSSYLETQSTLTKLEMLINNKRFDFGYFAKYIKDRPMKNPV